jgi:hypothetical protein
MSVLHLFARAWRWLGVGGEALEVARRVYILCKNLTRTHYVLQLFCPK